MNLQLYEMSHSPFCIPVSQALESLGIEFERIEIPNWDRGLLLRLTEGRYYQVPMLVHEGKVVTESTADSQDIAHYIDATFAERRLFPPESAGLQEILIEHIENDIEGVTFKLVDSFYIGSIESLADRGHVIRHKERRFGRGCVEVWQRERTSLREQADRLLDRFERVLQHQDFIMGSRPVYVDFSLFGVLGNLTYKGWNQLTESQSALRAWTDRLRAYRF